MTSPFDAFMDELRVKAKKPCPGPRWKITTWATCDRCGGTGSIPLTPQERIEAMGERFKWGVYWRDGKATAATRQDARLEHGFMPERNSPNYESQLDLLARARHLAETESL